MLSNRSSTRERPWSILKSTPLSAGTRPIHMPRRLQFLFWPLSSLPMVHSTYLEPRKRGDYNRYGSGGTFHPRSPHNTSLHCESGGREKKKERVMTLEQFLPLEGVSSLTPKHVLGKVHRRMARRWHASHYSRSNINKGLLCISLTRRRDEMVDSNFSQSISISSSGFSSLLAAYADHCPN
jgi:hypothetical protein